MSEKNCEILTLQIYEIKKQKKPTLHEYPV
jgi:hypothetical protein